MVLVPHDVARDRRRHCGQHPSVAEEPVMALLLPAQPPAEVHQACRQEAKSGDLLVYFHPLESAGSSVGVSTRLELQRQC